MGDPMMLLDRSSLRITSMIMILNKFSILGLPASWRSLYEDFGEHILTVRGAVCIHMF